MSIPEAPFDGEAHARKEGQWVESYDKTTLNAFVELVRSFYAGCKHYYDEIVKIVADLVREAPADDVPYVRQNKNWVNLEDFLDSGGGGGDVVDLEIINSTGDAPVELIPAKHYFVTPYPNAGWDIYTLKLILPPTSLRETKITVSPRWGIDRFTGMIESTIELHPSSESSYLYTGDGQYDVAILPMMGTYHLVAMDGVWYIADATGPSSSGGTEQPS